MLGAAGGVGASTVTTLTLDGDVANTATNSFVSGGKVFDTGFLQLSVPNSTSGFPFSVEQDDVIVATVMLTNGPFVVPASPEQFIGLNFSGPTDPFFAQPGDVVLSGNFEFYLGSSLVYSTGGNCGNCGSLITFGGTTSLSFDRVEASLTFINLTAPYSIDAISLSYQLSQPVPEPATWAMWAIGLAAGARWARRRNAR